MLEVVVKNTEEDVAEYKREVADAKLQAKVEYWKCRRCKHKWHASIGEMMDDPTCRNCGK